MFIEGVWNIFTYWNVFTVAIALIVYMIALIGVSILGAKLAECTIAVIEWWRCRDISANSGYKIWKFLTK